MTLMSTLENGLYLPMSNKKGWPWEQIEDNPIFFTKNNQTWPKISVITPSYNQGVFIEQTIRSVLLQGYPNLEYIIIDGGSTDGTVDIIRKYEKWFTSWVSEPDRGQSHALNKGFAKSSGDILCWLNSDDIFEPGALEYVGRYFSENPICQWLVGQSQIIENEKKEPRPFPARYSGCESLERFWEAWAGGTMLPQQSSFWRREASPIPVVNEDLHYAMDYELWLRLSKASNPVIVPQILASYRFHSDSKTVEMADNFLPEQLSVARRYWRDKGLTYFLQCEIAWRRSRAENLFMKAFYLKNQGDTVNARRMLASAIKYYPLAMGRWSILNLFARLTVGDGWVDRLKLIIGQKK